MSTNSANTLLSVTVVGGPNAADIADSLFSAYSQHKLPVRFTVDIADPAVGYLKGVEFDANITGVTYESGFPGLFIIKFYVVNHVRWGLCEGFYNANQRTGTFAMNMS